MTARHAAALLAAVMLTALTLVGGAAALLYVVVFLAAVAPGIPLGLALFGPRHPVAWIGGALVGYGLTQLALWAAIAAGLASAPAFLCSWGICLAAAYGVGRMARAPVVPVIPWTAPDVRALLLVLLLAPVLMGITYRNLGREDEHGRQYYRAYFTADFLWHTALAHELGKFTQPPRNPYLASRAMNYYWTYFLLPAAVSQVSPVPALHDVQRCLEINGMLAGSLMIGALFVLVRSGTRSAGPAAIAVSLAVLAASAEGTYAVVDLVRRGRPLAALTDMNIDAISNWVFGGLRVDNIPRSLWYTPQHTTSIALGIVGLTMAVLAGAAAPFAAIAGAGLALGLATTMNPLLGAVCSMLYGICVVADAAGRPRPVVTIARHAVAALFVIAAVGWGAVSRVMDGAGSALDFGFSGFSRNSPVITLLLSLGPVLLPALAGVFGPRSGPERRGIAVGAAGIAVGLFLLYFVRISEASWVGFRAGQILLVSIPVLLARTLDRLPALARSALAGAILVVGLPTTAIDTYNAQDIGNRNPGPGFRWTLWTTAAQREAFDWIRTHTRDEDIVQMEPIVRGREHWTLIPSFAGRRMAAGEPISLLPVPEYRQRSEQVRALFATTSPDEARTLAHRLRIDYLYVDQDDLRAYPEGTSKFEGSAAFERVYANDEVRIYRVR